MRISTIALFTLSLMAVPGSTYAAFELAGAAGSTYFLSSQDTLLNRQKAAWGSLAYLPTPRWGFGFEGGSFLQVQDDVMRFGGRPLPLSSPYDWIRRTRLTSSGYYLGGFLKANTRGKRAVGTLQAGGGVFVQSVQLLDTSYIRSLDGSFEPYDYGSKKHADYTNPAATIVASTQVCVWSDLYLGLGLRSLFIFQKGDRLSNAVTSVASELPTVHRDFYRPAVALIPMVNVKWLF